MAAPITSAGRFSPRGSLGTMDNLSFLAARRANAVSPNKGRAGCTKGAGHAKGLLTSAQVQFFSDTIIAIGVWPIVRKKLVHLLSNCHAVNNT